MGSHADAHADERRAAAGHAPIPARLRGASFAPRTNAPVKGGAVEALRADEHKLDTQLGLDFRCDVRLASRTVAVFIIKKDWSLGKWHACSLHTHILEWNPRKLCQASKVRHFRAWINLHVVKEGQGRHGRRLWRLWRDHQARESLLGDCRCMCARRSANLHAILPKQKKNLPAVSGAARTGPDRRTTEAVRPWA